MTPPACWEYINERSVVTDGGEEMTEVVAPFKDTKELREEIIEVCCRLTELGYCIGTWGNVSVRCEEGLLITPSAIDYSTMSTDDMVVVDWDGRKISGERLPSSEMQLHRLFLLRRPDMGAVVHTHSPYASTCAVANRSIPVTVDDMAQIIGGEVRCSEYAPGGKHIELAEAGWKALGDRNAAVILANHGPVVLGRNLKEATVAAQVLEKAAMLYVLASSMGCCVPITSDYVEEERHRYLYKYGRKEDASES